MTLSAFPKVLVLTLGLLVSFPGSGAAGELPQPSGPVVLTVAGKIGIAVYAGHRYARELDGPDIGDAVPFKRELTELAVL